MKDVIIGRFGFEDTAQVEANFHHSDLSQVSLHELVHMTLAKNTYFGTIHFIIAETQTQCLAANKQAHFASLHKTASLLQKCSEMTNESLSYYFQYYYVKISKTDEEYRSEVEEFQRKSVFNSYKLSRIFKYLDTEHWKGFFESEMLFRISRLAMNGSQTLAERVKVDEPEMLLEALTRQKDQYHPDRRFAKLLQALDKLLIEHTLQDISDELLLHTASLEASHFNDELLLGTLEKYKTHFTDVQLPVDMLESNIIRVRENFNQSKAEHYPEDTNHITDKALELLDLIRPTVINQNYNCITDLPREQFSLNLGLISSMWLLIQEDRYWLFYDDVALGKRYFYIVDELACKDMLDKFPLPVCVYSDDYEKVQDIFPAIRTRKMFVFHNGPYLQSKALINSLISKRREIMFYHLNNDFTFVFFKIADHVVLYSLHPASSIQLIIRDLLNREYRYVNTEDTIDRVFWFEEKDWWLYEDVMKSTSQTFLFDRNRQIPPLGNRVHIADYEDW